MRTWAEINLDNVAHNYYSFAKLTGKRVMCVLKANAYGHGAIALAKRLEKEGCNAFGVATLDEGLELRRAGIRSFILLFNHIDEHRIIKAIENNLTMTVYSVKIAEQISKTLSALPSRNSIKSERCLPTVNHQPPTAIKIHLKVDTGMNRVGFNPCEAVEAIKQITKLPRLEIEGLYTHFSSSDETDVAYTNKQIDTFKNVCDELEKDGIKIKIKHAANSSGAVSYPNSYFDMVRIGISLYGCYTSDEVIPPSSDFLKYAMQLKTQIFHIKEVDVGAAIGYGRAFITKRKTKLATIPIGYADGLSRVMMGKLKVLVNGQLAPVVGKICMDQCMVDITDIKGEVRVLDEVVVFGEQKGAMQTVEAVADAMGTINYEILCMVMPRVPRVYFEGSKIVGTVNYLG